ncbi:MAG: hypothetical protein GXP33_12190 [Spirochaetes bacterium]|nr:hypothetical protein [Spirochaetota bacterium]
MSVKRHVLRFFPVMFFLVSLSFVMGEGSSRSPESAGTLSLSFQGAYTFGNSEGWGINGGFAPLSYKVVDSSQLSHKTDDPGRSLGTTWGGAQAKAVVSYLLKYPFLTGNGALFKDNSIAYKFSGELSPVSVNALVSVTVTPAALLKLSAGAEAGTGWYAGFNGLGRNLAGINNDAPRHEPFSGVVCRLWLSAAFQFDVGAVVPGEWMHIVMAAVPKVEYRTFTGADNNTPWQWEADEGENFNGFKFKSTYFLGYQLPLAVDTVGILVDTEQYMGKTAALSTMESGGWGSDFVKVYFGPLANIRLGEKSNLTVLFQLKNGRDYTDETIGNRFFEYRSYSGWYIALYRLALSYTVKF